MKNIGKIFIYLIILVSVTVTGIFILRSDDHSKKNGGHDRSASVQARKQPASVPEPEPPAAKKPAYEALRTDFTTNEEIREEYGRLETVELYNGEEFTGVVVAVGSDYTMITIAGVKKIPMESVKSRIIHR